MPGPDDKGVNSDRLNGWKEIANYLGKSVRTVQRWECDLGFPVHRIETPGGQIVYASRDEITEWHVKNEKSAAAESARISRRPHRSPAARLLIPAAAILAGLAIFALWWPGSPRAANTFLGLVTGIAFDSHDNLYAALAEQHVVVRITPAGTLSVVAGNGVRGFSNDGGPATKAAMVPSGVGLDRNGNLYIADLNRVRKVDLGGTITTIAGSGTNGFSGDGGAATQADINVHGAVAVDAAGNVYFAGGHAVRKVDTEGIITTVAGTGVRGFSGDGGPATEAQVNDPFGVALDTAGNLYIADALNHRVRRVGLDGTITTIAGTGVTGVEYGGYSGDGGPALAAALSRPSGLAFDAAGNLLIADTGNHRVRRVGSDGIIHTVAGSPVQGFFGDGGPASVASLSLPEDVTVDREGNILIADTYNFRIRKVTADGSIRTWAGQQEVALPSLPAGLALDRQDHLIVSDPRSNRIWRIAPGGEISTVAGVGARGYFGDGGPATAAGLAYPSSVAVDDRGDVYVADTFNHRIRKVSPGGVITTAAGTGSMGYSGDGGAAANARLNFPFAIAGDQSGNLFIADSFNNRIRKVDKDGRISTVTGTGEYGSTGDGGSATRATLKQPRGVLAAGDGTLYIAETDGHRVRKVAPDGIITTIAGNGRKGYSGDGGPATSASLYDPHGLLLDDQGNLFFSDMGNHCVRKVTADGIIQTVVGTGRRDFLGDGGPASRASLNQPWGLVRDAAGNLLVADYANGRIRRIGRDGKIETVLGPKVPWNVGEPVFSRAGLLGRLFSHGRR